MKHKDIFIVVFLIAISISFYLVYKPSPERLAEKYYVKLTDKIDTDIVLVNIEEGDRAFIGKLLQTIDSCKPSLILIDVFFVKEKESAQDSILIEAFKKVRNDYLGYATDTSGKILNNHSKFRTFLSGEGLALVDTVEGLSSFITPIEMIDSNLHELLALKVIEKWKPGFKHSIQVNQSIPIKFTRTLEQFTHFEGGLLNAKDHCQTLQNKVVIVGYLGPSNEDKHFTPIRFVKEQNDNNPDTYGAVIIANAIRTILEYQIQ